MITGFTLPDPRLALAAAMIGYLLGSIPFGLLLTRAAGLGDIRKIGSGNIGATNVLRTGRRGLAAATLVLDGAKGAASVLIGAFLVLEDGVLIGGLACVLGHLFPVWLHFRGGKGVATGLGTLIAADPLLGALACATWLVVFYLFRISSVAALSAFGAAPFLALIAFARPPVVVLALIVAGLVFWRHAPNIRRLRAGTEPRFGRKPASAPSDPAAR